ncbi:flagellar biosynthesis protein FliP [Thiospirochaeta perfilievii]|uniref:Flagellar biosynthetic protein FliP n=1 Tax=Thiospirochaeta perfilievii TaxID=252967 RepID=A0A5C1QHI1_9SPIO|nr:flagellar type III secretion system pore protein FliP [Thiospirochaeta perfilievii]QEN06026.1 flagellar biosynthesis protein FliP [Thiospirochaeta perfilievii]
MKKFLLIIALFLAVFNISAQENNPDGTTTFEEGNTTLNSIPFIDLAVRSPEDNREVALSIQLLLFLTILTLSPTLLVLLTGFLRIAIVLDFVKKALSLQQVPPNSVIFGIALFVTSFVMWPVFTQMYDNGFKPFSEGQIDTTQMLNEVEKPIRLFMFRQLDGHYDNVELFMSLRDLPAPNNLSEVPTHILIPAFVINELTVAFKMGILIYLPFIIIDMIVASTLMSMGMIMLPPVMISMPFKLILFILVDGWSLIVSSLVRSIL